MQVNGIGRGYINNDNSADYIYKITTILIRNSIPKHKLPLTNDYGFQIKKIYNETFIIFVDYDISNKEELKPIHFNKAVRVLDFNNIKFISKPKEMEITLL